MTIHLLVCDYFSDEMPEWEPSFPNFFVRMFNSAAGTEPVYRLYDVQNGQLPLQLCRGELYVITGARASAYDNDPWITALKDFIKRAQEHGVPMVGICFGHQLLAQALGGRVEQAAKGWGAGIRTSRIVDEEMERWFGGSELRLFYNHHDQVTLLPPKAQLLATSPFCPIEAFKIGSNIIGFQGHPEYTRRYMEHVIGIAKGESTDRLRGGLESCVQDNAMGQQVARFILKAISSERH